MLNNNGDIVWTASAGSTNTPDIWLRDGATGQNTAITATPVPEYSPQINDTGDIVWYGWNGATISSGNYEIYYYQRSTKTTFKLTNDTYDNMNPHINAKGQTAWVASVSLTNADIFFRDGLNGTNKNISNSPKNDDNYLCLHDNGWVVYAEDFGNLGTNDQIFVWDGTTLTQVTNNAYDNIYPQINDSNTLVWQGTGGTGTVLTDYEIFTTGSACTGCTCPGVICNDNNPCTTDTCDQATGNCVYTPKNCDDGNICTTDACDPATGNCVHTPIITPVMMVIPARQAMFVPVGSVLEHRLPAVASPTLSAMTTTPAPRIRA